jgi:hypothetical protein
MMRGRENGHESFQYYTRILCVCTAPERIGDYSLIRAWINSLLNKSIKPTKNDEQTLESNNYNNKKR